jgi:hypothetical protein
MDATTGLVNDRARWYQPQTGGFTSRDPAFATTDTAYTYSGDDPINNSDPTGLDTSGSSSTYTTYTIDGVPVELNCNPDQPSCVSQNAWIFSWASSYQQQQCEIQQAEAQQQQEAETLRSIEYAQEQIELIAEGKVAAPSSNGGFWSNVNIVQGLEGGANFIEGFGNSKLGTVDFATHLLSFGQVNLNLHIRPLPFNSSNPYVSTDYQAGSNVGTIYGFVPGSPEADLLASSIYYHILKMRLGF